MLSDVQKSDIIARALKLFERQYGTKRDAKDMVLTVDAPNKGDLCSIYISSIKDPLRLKLNLKKMDVAFNFKQYRNSQLQGYGVGMADEIYVCDIELPKREYVAFHNFIRSAKFKEQILDVDAVVEDDNIATTTEEGFILVLEDEGVSV